MKRGLCLTAALLGAGSLGHAGAQSLSAYRALASSLDQAASGAASGQNSLTTLNRLDAAQKALGELTPTLTNRQIVAGLSNTLDAARAAQARTPTELQAQVLLARGLMRKALYDQTVTALATSPVNALERLNVLAGELGADPAALRADAQAGRLNLVTWRLQRAATAKLSAALATVKAQQTATDYLNLARATGWFTVVQDAGRAQTPPLEVAQFEQALGQLAGGDTAALGRSLTSLRSGVGTLSRSLASAPRPVRSPAATGTAGAGNAATAAQPGVVTGTSSAGTTATGSTGKGTAPAAATTAANTSPVGTAPAAGTGSSSAGVDAAYSALGRALSSAGHADMETARAQLGLVPAALAGAPSALRSAPGYDALVANAQRLSERRGLRPSDVQALTAELSALENSASGSGTSMLDTLSGTASRGLGGPARAILTLLMALACAAPLYLLNLAFGSRNPFWRAINAALALLMLPLMLDGVFGFLGWLGDLIGVGPLRSLTNLSLSQAAYGLPFKGLIYLAAIGLATYGFRGLCVQFGLLGSGTPARTRANTVKSPTQTSLDWDEEL